MMKKWAVAGVAFSTVVSAYAQTAVIEQAPNSTEVNNTSPINTRQLKEDLLSQQKLSEAKNINEKDVVRYTGRELVENPEILEELFVKALIIQNVPILPTFVKLYGYVPNADKSLIDWANAILYKQTDLHLATKNYQNLVAYFPQNLFMRFQFAETLFRNKAYDEAKKHFTHLLKQPLSLEDKTIFEQYLEAIESKESWNFAFGSTFLNDKNLSNTAKEGTKMQVGSGTISSGKREKGQGISGWMSADKQWNLENGRFVQFDTNLSSKYYWNNKSYNDVNAYVGLGFGYSDARLNVVMMPNIQKRWYSGGSGASESLKSYSTTYGMNLDVSYWFTPSAKYNLSYNLGYDLHRQDSLARQYDGSTHILTNNISYFPNATQYFSLSLDLSKRNVSSLSNSYERLGLRFAWGQELPLDFNAYTSFGVAHRTHKGRSFLGILQDNAEYSARVSLSNKKIQYKGFIPKLTWSYTKTSSNIPIYSYSKNNVMLEIGKSF